MSDYPREAIDRILGRGDKPTLEDAQAVYMFAAQHVPVGPEGPSLQVARALAEGLEARFRGKASRLRLRNDEARHWLMAWHPQSAMSPDLAHWLVTATGDEMLDASRGALTVDRLFEVMAIAKDPNKNPGRLVDRVRHALAVGVSRVRIRPGEIPPGSRRFVVPLFEKPASFTTARPAGAAVAHLAALDHDFPVDWTGGADGGYVDLGAADGPIDGLAWATGGGEQPGRRMPAYIRDEVTWHPEKNGSGYVHATGSAFGYRIDIEVSPTGERWHVDMLNQGIVGSSTTFDRAKDDALGACACALLYHALGLSR